MKLLSPLTYKIAFKTAVIYFIIGISYIIVSDRVLSDLLVIDPGDVFLYQTIKGIGFVTITAIMLFMLIRYFTEQIFDLRKLSNESKSFQNHFNHLSADQHLLNELAFHQSVAGIFFCMVDQPVFWDKAPNKDELLNYIIENSKITKANQAMIQQYGTSENEIIGVSLKELLKEEPDGGKAAIKIMLDKGKNNNLTKEHKMDGSIIYTDGNYTCLYDELGRYIGHFGMQVDITEKVRIEQELLNSENRFKELAHTAPMGIIISDIYQNTLYVSPKFIEITGYTLDDMPSVEAWWPKAYPDPVFREQVKTEWTMAYEKAIASASEILPMQFPVICKNGERKILEFRMSTTGQFNYIVISDLTQKQVYKDKLIESERRYRQLFENNPQPLLIYDMKTLEILEINESSVNHYGYTSSDFLKMKITDLLSADEIPKLKSLLSDESKHNETRSGVWRHIKKDGQEMIVEIHSHTINYKGHESRHLLINDITEKSELEFKLMEQSNKLNRLIDSIPGVVFKIQNTKNAKVLFLSKYIEKLTSLSQSDFFNGNVNLFKLINADDLIQINKELNKAYINKSRFIVSFRMSTENGERWMWASADFENYNVDFNDSIIEGLMIDITDRIKSEERLMEAVINAEDATRKQISLEIHNDLQQVLVSSMMNIKALQEVVESENKKYFERYTEGMNLLNMGLMKTRAIAETLMPKSVADFGIVAAIHNIIDNNFHEITIELFENVGDQRFPSNVENGIYRIVHETIFHLINYANSRKAQIQLFKHEQFINLTIEYDGKGIDSKMIEQFGTSDSLTTIKHRITALRGTFEVNSSSKHGNFIMIDIPSN